MTQDHLNNLGSLALASRIRRLLYLLQADGVRVYRDLGLDFKPKWFPVFQYVADHPGASTTGTSQALGMAHPSVIAIIEELIGHELFVSRQNADDRRRREISLTAKGRRTRTELEPVWAAFADAGEEMTTEGGNDFMAALTGLEAALERRSAYTRIRERIG